MNNEPAPPQQRAEEEEKEDDEASSVLKNTTSVEEEPQQGEDDDGNDEATRGCCQCSRRKKLVICALICCLGLPVLMIISLWIASAVTLNSYAWPSDVPEIPASLAADSSTNDDLSIVIVGAGTAGLFAGYVLEKLGYHNNYIILEASSRFGGRVKRTDDFATGVPLDIGAEWIHDNPAILESLLQLWDDGDDDQLLNLEEEIPQTIEYQPETWTFWAMGRPVRRDFARFFYKEYKFYNYSWSQYLEDFVLPVVEKNIRYSSVVESIDYQSTTEGGVMVQTEDGKTYKADKVIVATPVSILMDGDIAFLPSISKERQYALDMTDWQPGLKVMMKFLQQFYTDFTVDKSLFGFLASDDDRINYNAVFRRPSNNHNVLGVFTVGESAGKWAQWSNDDIVEAALEELDWFYDGKASQYYQKAIVQNWVKKPYI